MNVHDADKVIWEITKLRSPNHQLLKLTTVYNRCSILMEIDPPTKQIQRPQYIKRGIHFSQGSTVVTPQSKPKKVETES